ncbi:MAG: DUF2461 domain-containing protein [Muribaculaceae bacterium]|nr:DUF2461 domain-containing protein [Muribaculaceae bacterium]
MNTTNYVPRLYEFLGQLAANNNREWFAAHKPLYTELRQLWEEDINRLIGYMSAWEPRLSHLTAKTSAYRIYRDTRFSPDKTPFKTYFSAAFSPYGKSTRRACYYLHMDGADESGLYGGMWCPDSAMLRKIRSAIVDNIEEFEGIVNSPSLQSAFPQWYGATLKTVPKGYDRNHPQAHYLRMKDYGRFAPVAPELFFDPSWPEIVAERFSRISPFIEFLNYSLDE